MSTHTPQNRRAKRREDRRDTIKQAAIEVFSTKGYHGAKVSDIVERVGVAQGTFYLYFEGKQPLFGELLNDFFTLVVTTVANWEPGSLDTRDNLRTELKRVGAALTQVLDENRELTKIFFKESSAVAAEFDETIREFYDTLAAVLTTTNQTLHRRGVIPAMNHELLAYSTIGSVERVVFEYVVSQTISHISVDELVEHLVELYMTGTAEPIPFEKVSE